MRRIMAVYDSEPLYAEKFAEYANQKERLPFAAVPFTSLSSLQAFLEKEKAEVLLIGEDAAEAGSEMSHAGRTICLGEAQGEAAGVPVICKYQACDAVLRGIMACLDTEAAPSAAGPRGRITGVYAPAGCCGKTAFALVLGRELARAGRVLFMSFEEFSGLSRLMETEFDGCLSDLLYYFRTGGFGRVRMGSLIYDAGGGLDCLPPVRYGEDLAELTGTEAAELVTRAAAEGGYQDIVLDVGPFTGRAQEVLDVCDCVYVPVRNDPVSEARLTEWRAFLAQSGKSGILEKLRPLSLPPFTLPVGAGSYLDRLSWSALGDFVRELTGTVRRMGGGDA